MANTRRLMDRKLSIVNNQSSGLWSPAERELWRPRAERNVWQCAEEHRILTVGAEPGPYRIDRVPYMKGPQEAFTDDEVEEIDIMSAAQVTKTTTVENMVHYAVIEDPGDAMYVVPRETDVEYASKKRFAPMAMASPAMRGHWSGSSRDLAIDCHTFDNMTLYFAWAGSPAALAQKSIRYLFMDEPDKYPAFTGREANPIALAEKRVTTFWDAKIVRVCTPTTQLGYINVSIGRSNNQEYYIPCPRCGERQILKFSQLKCPKTLRDPEEIIASEDVWYECEFCGHIIRDGEKAPLVAAGKWLPEGQTIDADGNIKGTPKRGKRHSGFRISGLLSPFPKVTWPRIMAKWFAANTPEGIAVGDLMDFHNSTIGDAHLETGKKLKAADLHKLAGGYSRGTVPPECKLLVAGVDYHETRTRGVVTIVYEVRGFGYGCRNWLIDSGWCSSWAEYDERVLLSPFPWCDGTKNETNPFLAVICSFEDSGYLSDKVYDHCRRHPGICIPTKGEIGPRRTPVQFTDLEAATLRRLTPKQRRRFRGMQLAIIDTSFFKDQVTAWAQDTFDEEGNITDQALTNFYDEVPSLYFTEFTNEQKVRIVSPKTGAVKYAWQPISVGAKTHSLDTAVLTAAAAYYKRAFYLRDPKLPAAKQAAGAARRRPGRRVGRMER